MIIVSSWTFSAPTTHTKYKLLEVSVLISQHFWTMCAAARPGCEPCHACAQAAQNQSSALAMASSAASLPGIRDAVCIADTVMQARASAAHPSGLSSADATARRLRSIGYSRLTMCGFTRGPTASFSMYLSTVQIESNNALPDYGTSTITQEGPPPASRCTCQQCSSNQTPLCLITAPARSPSCEIDAYCLCI